MKDGCDEIANMNRILDDVVGKIIRQTVIVASNARLLPSTY